MALSVRIYATAKHQTECGLAVRAGLARHGIAAELARPHEYSPTDLAVVWGHRQHGIMRGQKAAGARYLVMERGYFGDRFAFYSLGYDGLNGRADFCNAGAPGDRWQRYGWDLPAWKESGQIVLVMGQVLGDAALAHVNYREWQEKAVIAAKKYELPVYFRRHPHPRARADGTQLRVPLSKSTLEEDLARAAVVVTLNSNSGVDAVLAGVPAITYDVGAMAWKVTAHKIGEIARPCRRQWVHELAYAQWLLHEIESGEAWAHIGRGMRDRAEAAA